MHFVSPKRLLEIFDTVINVLCDFRSQVKHAMRQSHHLDVGQLLSLSKVVLRAQVCALFSLLFGLLSFKSVVSSPVGPS